MLMSEKTGLWQLPNEYLPFNYQKFQTGKLWYNVLPNVKINVKKRGSNVDCEYDKYILNSVKGSGHYW